MNKQVNALGDACPIPVIKTKEALKSLAPHDTVEVLVDNPTAVENLTKMAQQLKLAVSHTQASPQEYHVTLTLGDTLPILSAAQDCAPGISGETIVQITSSAMGAGNDELGKTLMKGFLFALTQQDTLPDAILFYNGGAYLTCQGSAALDDIKKLADEGVEILTCGTCLNFYGIADQLAVGGVTNLYAIAERLGNAGRIIRP